MLGTALPPSSKRHIPIVTVQSKNAKRDAAKTRIVRYNQALTGTGGGPATPPLDELDQLIADILEKQNVTVIGVNGMHDILTFLHEAVEQKPSATNDDAEEVQ
ncbi:hypothetical protein Pcinc_000023 [Petrolisthes cinctipes]|uniref:Uncharacterized protein n=1 Tax=Petrolisthes cinctipes TaxID=88211 RepID=A0AAE1GNJ6_PETCI|nr:hypothetical protein Pcinc_000023 [Petrolisthes cinctipes]